jgi:hypothetical protein
MKSHPLLCRDEVVRAIMSGAQTQDRRPIKLPLIDRNGTGCEIAGCEVNSMLRQGRYDIAPVQPGDEFWVRETWCGTQRTMRGYFRADMQYWDFARNKPRPERGEPDKCKWNPSIHMPQWACRIRLEVLSVKAERVRDISEEDAMAEGVEEINSGKLTRGATRGKCWKDYMHGIGFWNAKNSFFSLWQSIYGLDSLDWWVWAYTFRRKV